MSAESVARWNAIPMTRPEHNGLLSQSTGTKRPRDDDESEREVDVKMDGGESDDDISLVSRSPSPVPQNQMDIDKYDDYVRGPVREVITVDTKIKNTNKGFEMLSKLGWVEGQCLGLSPDARIDPIPFHVKNDATGLGKTSQDFRMIETTVSQRRELDSERQRNETEEQRKAREGNVARLAALQTEISEVLRPFYCTVCDKQFQNVAQYDEHTNSYAHHHKIRFRDMQNTQRAKQNTREEQDKRKEKERKREEKELRKIAAAAGVRMAKSAPSGPGLAPAASSAEPKPVGFRKVGWASISSAAGESSSSSSVASPQAHAGWAAVAPSPSAPAPPHTASPHTPPPAPVAISSSDGGFQTVAAATLSPPRGPSPIREQDPDAHRQLHQPAPVFRTGGWSSIDNTTRIPPPALPPIPSADVSAEAPADVHRHFEQWPSIPTSASAPSAVPAAVPLPSPAVPHPQASVATLDAHAPKTKSKKKEREAEIRENSRSGWQSFQKGGRRK
ncbi:hypothetical protein BC826DRAFT_1003781 [Russula brevipes]|nr:hypothetical protein BC826DRAFT_1003781 [Russula brevipes]